MQGVQRNMIEQILDGVTGVRGHHATLQPLQTKKRASRMVVTAPNGQAMPFVRFVLACLQPNQELAKEENALPYSNLEMFGIETMRAMQVCIDK